MPLVAQLTLHCRVSAGLVFAATACDLCYVNAPCPVDRTALRLECVSEPFCYQGEYYHARSQGELCRSSLFVHIVAFALAGSSLLQESNNTVVLKENNSTTFEG